MEEYWLTCVFLPMTKRTSLIMTLFIPVHVYLKSNLRFLPHIFPVM